MSYGMRKEKGNEKKGKGRGRRRGERKWLKEGSFILRFAETNGNKVDLEKINQKFKNKTKLILQLLLKKNLEIKTLEKWGRSMVGT